MTDSLPASLEGVVYMGLHRVPAGVGAGIKQQAGRGMLGGEGLWDPQMWAEGEGRLRRVFCCRDKMGLGDPVCRRGGHGKGLQMISWSVP